MDKYWQQGLDLWGRWLTLSTTRKIVWISAVVLCSGFAGLMWWISQPEYRVLYSGLSAEEAGAITGKLQSKGISFKLASGGSSILVPADQAMQVHIDLTADGIPGSTKLGKGFDLFDQPMLSATPFNQHVNYVRAQQTELARTIMQIDPIVFARVHIVRPEPSPFVREQKPTTASVVLKLRPGVTLHRNTVTGIVSLVAGSVEGLTKDNVRIVDSTGRLLSEERDPDTGSIGTFMDQRKDVEHYLAKEAERMLASVLGAGKAIVRVTVELNTKQMKERREIINADGRVAKSEKTMLTKSGGGASAKGGASGSSSNLGKAGATSTSGSLGSTSETQQSDYDYPRTIVEWQNKHGSIDRLTVAAFVDAAVLNNSEAPIPLAEVQEIIKKAVGFKSDRDEIQVTAVRMPGMPVESVEDEAAAQSRFQSVLTIVRNVSMTMVALCFLPLIVVLVRRLRPAPPPPVPVPSTPSHLRLIAEEFERHPEAFAKILEKWMDASTGTAPRKVA